MPEGTEILETAPITPLQDSTPATLYTNPQILSQASTENILRTHLAKHGVHVELNTELRRLEQNQDHVIAHLVKHDGEKEHVESVICDYMTGADGGRGITRKLLGLTFLGQSHQEDGHVLGEIELEGLSPEYWHTWGDITTRMAALRLTEVPNVFVFNIDGQVDYQLIQKDRESFINFIYEYANRRDLKLGAITWIGEFRPNIRMVDTFDKGRVFVAGDVAHVHSPTGGQGLNPSVQDAFNISWKLALVLKYVSPPSLLHTYTSERVPIIRTMLGYTTELLDKLQTANVAIPGSLAAGGRLGKIRLAN